MSAGHGGYSPGVAGEGAGGGGLGCETAGGGPVVPTSQKQPVQSQPRASRKEQEYWYVMSAHRMSSHDLSPAPPGRTPSPPSAQVALRQPPIDGEGSDEGGGTGGGGFGNGPKHDSSKPDTQIAHTPSTHVPPDTSLVLPSVQVTCRKMHSCPSAEQLSPKPGVNVGHDSSVEGGAGGGGDGLGGGGGSKVDGGPGVGFGYEIGGSGGGGLGDGGGGSDALGGGGEFWDGDIDGQSNESYTGPTYSSAEQLQ